MLVFLAAIESTNMVFLKQTLSVASYEGVRLAIQDGADSSTVIARCNEILDARLVSGTSVSLDPETFFVGF